MGTEREHVSDVESDFQATSETVAADAERLRSLEAKKASLDPADPRRTELSEEAVLLAEEIRKMTTIELALDAEATQS